MARFLLILLTLTAFSTSAYARDGHGLPSIWEANCKISGNSVEICTEVYRECGLNFYLGTVDSNCVRKKAPELKENKMPLEGWGIVSY